MSKALRAIGWLVGAAVLIGAGGYLFVYLARWEWHRALIAGVFLIAAEVAVTAALVARWRSPEEATEPYARPGRPGRVQPAVSRRGTGARCHTANRGAPPGPARRPSAGQDVSPDRAEPAAGAFAWLRPPPDAPGVFIPVLLGSGVIVSGLTWLIEHLAGGRERDAGGTLEHLEGIRPPQDGLVPAAGEALAGGGRPGDDEELRLLLGPDPG